jgi:hypothetical protein
MGKESAFQLVRDIETTIERHRYESEMTIAEAVGCIEFVKHGMMKDAFADEVACILDGCEWSGKIADCKYLGHIGPLCPECGETVEEI